MNSAHGRFGIFSVSFFAARPRCITFDSPIGNWPVVGWPPASSSLRMVITPTGILSFSAAAQAFFTKRKIFSFEWKRSLLRERSFTLSAKGFSQELAFYSHPLIFAKVIFSQRPASFPQNGRAADTPPKLRRRRSHGTGFTSPNNLGGNAPGNYRDLYPLCATLRVTPNPPLRSVR